MISLYERGEKAPSVEVLVNLADFLGCPQTTCLEENF